MVFFHCNAQRPDNVGELFVIEWTAYLQRRPSTAIHLIFTHIGSVPKAERCG
jgi:hypothetical protein